MKKTCLILLAVLVMLGAAARLYRPAEKSLWSDEIATIATSLGNSIDPDAYRLRHERFDPPAPVPANVYRLKALQSHGAGNLAQTIRVLQSNVHPPLFFGLMNLWIHAVGLEPGQLRLPAIFFGILAIPLMYGFALRLADLDSARFSGAARPSFALLATGMMALSAYQIDHAQDARQYTLLILLALLAGWLCLTLVRQAGRDWRPWLGLALVLAAGLYTQYFFMGFAGFIILYLAWQGRRDKVFLLMAAGLALLVAGLFGPWLGVFKAQMAFFKSVGHYTAGLWKPLQLPEKLWRIGCDFFLPASPVGKLLPLLILLAALFPGLKQRFSPRCEDTGRFSVSPVLLFLLGWLLVVVGGQVALDILKQTHTATIRRYLLLASPACYLVMAYVLVQMGQKLRDAKTAWVARGLSVVLLGLMAFDSFAMLKWDHTSSDEFHQAAGLINASALPDDLVLVNKSGAMAVGMAYYLRPEICMWGLDIPDARLLAPNSALMGSLEAHMGKRVWLVFSHAAPSTQNRLGVWLNAKGYRRLQLEKVPGVQVSLWRRELG